MSSRKRYDRRQQPLNRYSIVSSHEDDGNQMTTIDIALQDMDHKINNEEDESSISTSYSSEIDVPMSSSQKQYSQTLKQIMEQELEEPEFEFMMDEIIRSLIYITHEEDQVIDIDSAIQYLHKCSVEHAMISIGSLDAKLATEFTDSFTERHENAAMEIMLEICIKILNMRKLISDYPMIFVPLSFHLYQPRFMSKKTERKHKLQKQRRKRQSTLITDVFDKNPSHIIKNTLSQHIHNNDINDVEDSLSVLSRGPHDDITDDNTNNGLNAVDHIHFNLNNNDMINKTKSLPISKSQQVLKRRASTKRSKTRSRLRFEKTRSGASLVLLPLPVRSNKIFGGNGHFQDQSTVFKHRLSDVSTHQINTIQRITSPSMNDIQEEDEEDIVKNKASRREHKKSMECTKLRQWTEAFVFKKMGNINYKELIKGRRIICEGCQTEIKLKDKANITLTMYEAGETNETAINGMNKKTFKKTFVFHDLYCETLRKYKEAIRQYAFEYEFALRYQTVPCDLLDPDRYIHLFAMKDDLLVVDSALSRNANIEDKKPHKPCFDLGMDASTHSMHNLFHHKNVSDAGLRRERRLALLNLWREAECKVLPKQSMELEIERSMKQLDEFGELPELLKYIDVSTFGRPLWYFCVDQLSTKDRRPLWCILEFLATELPTSMAINLLRSTRDALVRFHVEPLDNVCLKIMASSTYPIATALYLAAFMQSNAIGDSSRAHDFNDISNTYIDIATDLLSQIESDHLLAILIEIKSNIDDLSILDIVVRFKLERFLEFHRLQPIFMNMWTQYEYLDPSQPFRNSEADSLDLMSLCWRNSALFYYSPVGAFTLHCTTYIFHVVLVSIMTAKLLYPYKAIHGIEWMVWVFNAGFVLYEISELTIRKLFGYFEYYSNLIGFIIAINWLILAFIRFYTYYWNIDYYHSIGCGDDIDDVCYRNAPLTKVYMIFWSIQLILLWCKMAALLQRNKHCGPLLRMIMNMMLEICSFALLLFIFVIGFVLAVYYIVGGDVPPSEEGGGLNRISSVFLYHIQALLAAQEWGVIISNRDDGFDSDRSIMVETCMVLASIFGTLLLMNLFIALLTITYESEKQNARLKTNFARITHTIELNDRSKVMPPPVNLLVFALTLIYELFEFVVVLSSCGYWTTKLQELYPIKYSLQKALTNKENESAIKRKESIFTHTAPPEGMDTYDDDDDDTSESNDLFQISKQATADTRSKYMMDNVHCGCFVRLSGHSRKKNRCHNLIQRWTEKEEKYCRYCRHSLRTKGNIDRYFELFKHWQLLDEDDKQLLRLWLNGRNLCPHCFRSYKSKKHGLNRCQVMLEVLSYYVFKILIWWWLLLILAIPALIRKIYIRLNYNYSQDTSNFTVQIISNVSQTDPKYRLKVNQVIKHYKDKDKEDDTQKHISKTPSIHENYKSLSVLNSRSIEPEFENMFERNIHKHKQKQGIDEKFNIIESRMEDIKRLIIQQKTIEKHGEALLLSPPSTSNNKTKKVTFNQNKQGHKHRETQFETLMNAMDNMKNELSSIKQHINVNEEHDEDNNNEHNYDDDIITPRIVSHARTNAPISPINAISDLNIHQILPKDKSTRL